MTDETPEQELPPEIMAQIEESRRHPERDRTRWRPRRKAAANREIIPGIVELTAEEGRAMFDERCQETLGISGEEFLRRWDAGEYGDDLDRCEHRIVEISMLIPFAR